MGAAFVYSSRSANKSGGSFVYNKMSEDKFAYTAFVYSSWSVNKNYRQSASTCLHFICSKWSSWVQLYSKSLYHFIYYFRLYHLGGVQALFDFAFFLLQCYAYSTPHHHHSIYTVHYRTAEQNISNTIRCTHTLKNTVHYKLYTLPLSIIFWQNTKRSINGGNNVKTKCCVKANTKIR